MSAQERAPEKVVFILIDGVGDVSIPQLGNITPLQAAHTPFMDAIAAGGLSGLVDPVAPGLACGSDTAHLSLFGYNPRRYYRGRGAFETMGAGLDMSPGDIAFKSNFATLDEASGVVVSRRADRRFEEEGPELCGDLDGLVLPSFPQHTVRLMYATEHRCGVSVSGPGLSDAISGTDPLRDGLPLLSAKPTDDSPEAEHTAAVVNELCREMRRVLSSHPVNQRRAELGKPPANVVLLRGCGSRLAVQPFQERHGMRACCVAPTKIIGGLAMSFGIDRLDAPGATGDYRSKFCSKAKTAAAAVAGGGYGFVFLHVKAVDDTGHDRLTDMKVLYLEALDMMVGQLLRRLSEAEQPDPVPAAAMERTSNDNVVERTSNGIGADCTSNDNGTDGSAAAAGTPSYSYSTSSPPTPSTSSPPPRFTVVITADHSTPCVFGDHSHEPVPLAIAHVRHVVQAAEGGSAAVAAVPLGDIPHPQPCTPAERAVRLRSIAAAAAARQRRRRGSSGGGEGCVVFGDCVTSFDEVAAAQGCLGRFPGSEVMGLVKSFAGVTSGAPVDA